MDLSALYSTYSDEGRNQYSPSVLLKICILGYSRKEISSRAIERACRENIKYMYLLNGENPPDHNTIARFRSKHLAECQDQILAEMTRVLMEMDEISFEKSAVFIDGTKIESVGNRYKFVWKKSVEKNLNKLQETMRSELPDMLKSLGLKLRAGDVIKAKHLKKARKQICAIMENACRKGGIGKDDVNPWEKLADEQAARLRALASGTESIDATSDGAVIAKPAKIYNTLGVMS